MGNPERIRIAIVESDARWRNYLSVLLGEPLGYTCAGTHTSVDKALRNLPFEKPDVVVLGWERSDIQLVETILHFKVADRRLHVNGFCRCVEFSMLRALLVAGADAVVSKTEPRFKLFEAIECVRDGGASLSDCIFRAFVES